MYAFSNGTNFNSVKNLGFKSPPYCAYMNRRTAIAQIIIRKNKRHIQSMTTTILKMLPFQLIPCIIIIAWQHFVFFYKLSLTLFELSLNSIDNQFNAFNDVTYYCSGILLIGSNHCVVYTDMMSIRFYEIFVTPENKI